VVEDSRSKWVLEAAVHIGGAATRRQYRLTHDDGSVGLGADPAGALDRKLPIAWHLSTRDRGDAPAPTVQNGDHVVGGSLNRVHDGGSEASLEIAIRRHVHGPTGFRMRKSADAAPPL